MSGMINSADKFYLVYHRGNAMHFQGFKSEEDTPKQLLYQARIFSNESTAERIQAVEQAAQRVIALIKQDDEAQSGVEQDDDEFEA